MEAQTHKLHIPVKMPWNTIIVAIAIGVMAWTWNDHVTDIRSQMKEVRVEVQKNGKALARIEAILEK